MKDLLLFLAKSLVENPDSVVIEEETNDGVVSFKLHVADEDMGRIIGKQGKIAKAIRTVMKSAAIRQGVKVEVDII